MENTCGACLYGLVADVPGVGNTKCRNATEVALYMASQGTTDDASTDSGAGYIPMRTVRCLKCLEALHVWKSLQGVPR